MDEGGALALVELGRWLRGTGYRFVTVTPETHRRVLARAAPRTPSLRDIFGWNRSFSDRSLPVEVMDLLRAAGVLRETNDGYRSAVRFSSLGVHLFAHSSYPTRDVDAVFFGPDTYRFCAALQRTSLEPSAIVDVGCGSGVGGIVCSAPGSRVVLADISEEALAFAGVNAALAGLEDVEIVKSDVLAQVEGAIDLVIANPPYLRDSLGRTYRDGSGLYGEGLAARIVTESLARLEPGGTLILYTGAVVVDGHDTFLEAVSPALAGSRAHVRYEELDPDVFGEELVSDFYQAADRIAAVLLTVRLS
jgi:SAM-dependent methyltransferase